MEQKLDAAIRILPSMYEAWYNRAIVRAADKRYDAALQDLDSALARNGDITDIFKVKSEILMEAGRYEPALTILNRILSNTLIANITCICDFD